MIAADLIIAKLAPVKLHLLTRRRFIATHRKVSGFGWAQRLDKGFELADAAGIAEDAQAVMHGGTIEQMILLHPAADLFFERIQLHGFGGPSGWYRRAAHILTDSVARQAELSTDCVQGHALRRQFVNGMHRPTPEHRAPHRS